MRIGGVGKRKKNGVLLIFVISLHITEKGRRLEENQPSSSAKLCKAKIHFSKSQEEQRKSIIYTI